MESKRKHRLEIMLHILTAMILMIKGYDKIGHHHLAAGGIIVGFGILVLFIALFGEKMGLSHKTAKLVCYAVESVALFITAYVFFGDGKKFIPYLYAFAAVMYLVAVVLTAKKREKVH